MGNASLLIARSAEDREFLLSEENKALWHRYTEGLNNGNTDILDEIAAPDFIVHSTRSRGLGHEAFKQLLTTMYIAFPDWHWGTEDR